MQGCLLSKDECNGKSCNTLTLGKNSTPISNDAFQETIVSNSEHHPTSERNISTSLGRDIDAFDFKSIHELEVHGRLRLDICCYNDPRSNCNGISSHQPNRLSIPNCISTQGKDVLSFSMFRYKICLNGVMLHRFNTSLSNLNFRYIKFRRNKPKNIQQSKSTNRPRPCLTLRFDCICIFDNHGRIHIISCQVRMNIFSNIYKSFIWHNCKRLKTCILIYVYYISISDTLNHTNFRLWIENMISRCQQELI